MKRLGSIGSALLIAAAFALGSAGLAANAQAGSHCVKAGGEATMVTTDLGKFMAKAALKNSIAGMGAKPAGEISMTCKEDTLTTHCIAHQRACK